MAVSESLQKVSIPANADLSASQYCFVIVNSTGKAVVAGDGEAGVGVLQDTPAAADRPAEIAISGRSKVKLGGTIATGAKACSDSTGRAVTGASAKNILGIMLKGGAVNEIGEILLAVQPPVLA